MITTVSPLELPNTEAYDIIFLDVVLPGMDGYKTCRTIKADKRTHETPVIMITGKSSPFDKIKGKLAGCDTYLTKPMQHATFKNMLKKYLKRRKHDLLEEGTAPDRTVLGHA